MSKATHNGHCQVCGRTQAVNSKTGRLAKHGYTVDWGFFNGVCHGSGNLPLEVDTTVTKTTIEKLTKESDRLLALTVSDINEVIISVYDKNRGKSIPTKFNRESFDKWKADNGMRVLYTTWESSQENTLRCYKSQAKQLVLHKIFLEDLITTVHGQQLIERK